MQRDAMKIINAAIEEVLADEFEQLDEDLSNLRFLVGQALRREGRDFCQRVEDGDYENANR